MRSARRAAKIDHIAIGRSADAKHAFNTRIHGIAAHHVAGQPTFADVHVQVDRHLAGRITVAHSGFDKGALAAACRVHDRPAIATRWLDSVRVARRAWPDLANHRLGDLARFLGIPHRHHDALSDARAAGWVIVRAGEHTGLSLADWMAPPRPPGPAPAAAPDGPLRGERVAILGEPRDGPLAHRVAALGGTVMSSVGLTTTMLAVAAVEPFGPSILTSTAYRRARKAIDAGRGLKIVAAGALPRLIDEQRPPPGNGSPSPSFTAGPTPVAPQENRMPGTDRPTPDPAEATDAREDAVPTEGGSAEAESEAQPS